MPQPTQSRKVSGRNSAHKKKPSAFSVRVAITGSGHRASLYAINSEILETLLNTPIAEAQYEDNPFSNVGNLALSSCRVCLGLDIDNDKLEAEMFVDDIQISISKVGFVPEGCDTQEELGEPLQNCLVALSDDVEMLNDYADSTINLADSSIFVLEVEEYKHGRLSVAFESSILPNPGDLKLGLVDVDDPDSHVSQFTYANGLLGNVEKEIRHLIAYGTKHEFELEILNGYSSSFYLIRNDGSKPEFLDPETTVIRARATSKSGEVEEAFQLLLATGDLNAIHTAAGLYSDPKCPGFDLDKAIELYLAAARRGWTSSQYNLAVAYLEASDGCAQSLEKAYYWAHQVYFDNNSDADAKSIMEEVEQTLVSKKGIAATIVIDGLEFDTLAAASGHYLKTLDDEELPVLIEVLTRHDLIAPSVAAAKKNAKKDGVELTLSHLAHATPWTDSYKFLAALYESVQNLPKAKSLTLDQQRQKADGKAP